MVFQQRAALPYMQLFQSLVLVHAENPWTPAKSEDPWALTPPASNLGPLGSHSSCEQLKTLRLSAAEEGASEGEVKWSACTSRFMPMVGKLSNFPCNPLWEVHSNTSANRARASGCGGSHRSEQYSHRGWSTPSGMYMLYSHSPHQ